MKHLLLYISAMVLMLGHVCPVAAHSAPDGIVSIHNDSRQQQDPKPPKVITARVTRSVENELITIVVTFPDDASAVKVSMFNILGKLIDIQTYGPVTQGESNFQFQTKGLPNGPYLIVLESGTQRITNKVMISR